MMIDDDELEENDETIHRKMNVFNTEILIDLVRKKPALWDRNCRDYRISKQDREKCWQELCEAMDPEFRSLSKTQKYDMVRKVQKKWYNTRDSYRKCQKRGKPYLFSEQMKFLEGSDSCQKRVDNDEDPVNFTFGDKSDDEEYTQEIYFDTDEHKFVDENKKKKRHGIYLEADDVDVSPAKVLKTSLPNEDDTWISTKQSTSYDSFLPLLTSIMQREDDEDRGFFNSLLPTVKKLSHEDKMDFKIRVLTVLKELSVKKEKDPIESD